MKTTDLLQNKAYKEYLLAQTEFATEFARMDADLEKRKISLPPYVVKMMDERLEIFRKYAEKVEALLLEYKANNLILAVNAHSNAILLKAYLPKMDLITDQDYEKITEELNLKNHLQTIKKQAI